MTPGHLSGEQAERDRSAARFWAKVEKQGPDDCWLWLAAKSGRGYGRFSIGRKGLRAHRFAYELLIGPIPDGLTIDHLCRNTSCVNPAHMEPVTVGENTLRGDAWSGVNSRKTHCLKGHPLKGANVRKRGSRRICRRCEAETQSEWTKAQRARLKEQGIPSSKAQWDLLVAAACDDHGAANIAKGYGLAAKALDELDLGTYYRQRRDDGKRVPAFFAINDKGRALAAERDAHA